MDKLHTNFIIIMLYVKYMYIYIFIYIVAKRARHASDFFGPCALQTAMESQLLRSHTFLTDTPGMPKLKEAACHTASYCDADVAIIL